MPVGINQPSNQIKLTNVSLVRMKRGKKRFEIPCYKNKVLEYRAGDEKDLDNVLQIRNVFTNVSKGQVAPNEDLEKAFPGKSREDIVLEILNKGELQVGEKERQAGLENVKREVVEWVAGRVVDPKTKRVYTTGMVEKALDMLSAQAGQATSQKGGEHAAAAAGTSGTNTPATGENGEASKGKAKALPLWTGVVTTKDAKSQALAAIKALIAHQPIPVARARMRLRITCPSSITKQAAKAVEGKDKATGTVKDKILSYVEQVESQDMSGAEWEVVGFVEPGAYKTLTEFISTQTKGKARAEVLDMAVVHEGD